MDNIREDLLQTAVQGLMAIMRHVRHPGPPPFPPLASREKPLSPPQAALFFTIAHKPEGVSVKELAEFLDVTPGAITQFVDSLVEKGLVMREGDPADRRIVRLKVTPQAKEQSEIFRRQHLAAFSAVFEVLSNEDLRQLIALMDKIEASQAGKDRSHAETH